MYVNFFLSENVEEKNILLLENLKQILIIVIKRQRYQNPVLNIFLVPKISQRFISGFIIFLVHGGQIYLNRKYTKMCVITTCDTHSDTHWYWPIFSNMNNKYFKFMCVYLIGPLVQPHQIIWYLVKNDLYQEFPRVHVHIGQ